MQAKAWNQTIEIEGLGAVCLGSILGPVYNACPSLSARSPCEIQMKSDTYDAVATPEAAKIPKVGFVSLGCPKASVFKLKN